EERSGIHGQIGLPELRVVEEVEELRSKLRMEPLFDRDLFHEGNIPIIEAGDLHDVSSGISERARPRCDEALGIEVAVDGTIVVREIPIAAGHRDIGTLERIA